MAKKQINLVGKVCPFPVMCIVREVDLMKKGQTLKFLVDDPLAIKSAPEELEEYDNVKHSVKKKKKHWEITVSKK